MSERNEGWYWVKDEVEGWHPAQWLGRWCSPYVIQHGGLRDSYYLKIGPRIPTPDEPWQTVPTHRPNIDMVEAGMSHVMRGQDYERAQACWKAMLAAAPKPGGGDE